MKSRDFAMKAPLRETPRVILARVTEDVQALVKSVSEDWDTERVSPLVDSDGRKVYLSLLSVEAALYLVGICLEAMEPGPDHLETR